MQHKRTLADECPNDVPPLAHHQFRDLFYALINWQRPFRLQLQQIIY